MKIKRKMRPILTTLGTLLYAAPLTTEARDDQAWLGFDVSGAFAKEKDEHPALSHLEWKAEEQLKYMHSTLIAEETLALLTAKPFDWLTIGGGYRLARERNGQGNFRNEHRPTFEVTLTAPEFASLKVDLRSRVEWRNKKGSKAHVRFRERLRVRTSWNVTDFKISPYASCELFFEDKPQNGWRSDDWFNRTRSQVGISFRPIPSNENLTVLTYFMVQHDCADQGVKWNPTNVYGLQLNYKF